MSTSAITIRSAGISDVPAIAAVHFETWLVAYTDFLTDDYIKFIAPKRCSIDKWHSIMAELGEECSVHVAERDDAIIGFVQFGPADVDSSLGEIHRLYLHPSEWGSGGGQALMDSALEELSACGRPTVRLWTPATPRSRRFYERNVFVATGVTEEIVLDGGVMTIDKEFIRHR